MPSGPSFVHVERGYLVLKILAVGRILWSGIKLEIARGCTQVMASADDSAIRNVGLSLPLTAPPGE
jgi:hypothetical protein